jgi:SAM-dependent methyltransferase
MGLGIQIMTGFDNPLQTWNARYAREDFHFGEEPNAFLLAHADCLSAGQSALCVADGEGRNSTFLAERGMKVTAFDFAPNAFAKAKGLAVRRGVHVEYRLGDVFTWNWTSTSYDAVVGIFIQFLSPVQREGVFAGMMHAVRPGGLLLLEGYRPEQVDYCTGGPPHRENMYTRDWLERQFSDWDIVELSAYDAVIHEGQGHSGLSALIDLVARKPPAVPAPAVAEEPRRYSRQA